jgi:hypothetical protein
VKLAPRFPQKRGGPPFGGKKGSFAKAKKGLSLSGYKERVLSFLPYPNPSNIPSTSLLRIARQTAVVKDLAGNIPYIPLFPAKEIYRECESEAHP